MKIELNPQIGQRLMGCTDALSVSNDKCSRIYDTFIAAVKAGIDPLVIWNSLPANEKLDMNYGNWQYTK